MGLGLDLVGLRVLDPADDLDRGRLDLERLALALRHRGVPARVVNGYRLGPWIDEGGYWLVTQDQAHSWVEYFDPGKRAWIAEDPTPAAPVGGMSAETLWAALQRWTDALRFRWDRHVLRFSDEDQLAGLDWIRARTSGWREWRMGRGTSTLLASGLALLLALRMARRFRRWRSRPRPVPGPRAIRSLKPLLRRTQGLCPPRAGETARGWILRLAEARPRLRPELEALANEVDAVAYGGRQDARLRRLAREAARECGRN